MKPRTRSITFFRKSNILIRYMLVAWCLLYAVGRARASTNDKSTTKALVQDTLIVIRGTVVDSLLNNPIPFASITYYRDDSVSMTILSNQKGEFLARTNKPVLKVKISAVGYQEEMLYLKGDRNNLLRLVVANKSLPNVIVSSKAKKKANADWIIKRFNKQFKENYGDLSFDQKFNVNWEGHNYDTAKFKTTAQLFLHFDKDDKSIRAKNWKEDTIHFDAAFWNFIGGGHLIIGDLITNSDMLRRGMMVSENQIKNFDLKILSNYRDEKNGSVYLVSFKPHHVYTGFMGGHTIGDLEHGFLKGELLIREEDFAVVNLKYTFELKNDMVNRSLEESFHNGTWKVNRLSKIMSDLLIFKHEYSYRKDSATGKYFVETIKLDCNNTGYDVANHRHIQLYFQCDAMSSGIEGVVE